MLLPSAALDCVRPERCARRCTGRSINRSGGSVVLWDTEIPRWTKRQTEIWEDENHEKDLIWQKQMLIPMLPDCWDMVSGFRKLFSMTNRILGMTVSLTISYGPTQPDLWPAEWKETFRKDISFYMKIFRSTMSISIDFSLSGSYPAVFMWFFVPGDHDLE